MPCMWQVLSLAHLGLGRVSASRQRRPPRTTPRQRRPPRTTPRQRRPPRTTPRQRRASTCRGQARSVSMLRATPTPRTWLRADSRQWGNARQGSLQGSRSILDWPRVPPETRRLEQPEGSRRCGVGCRSRRFIRPTLSAKRTHCVGAESLLRTRCGKPLSIGASRFGSKQSRCLNCDKCYNSRRPLCSSWSIVSR